MNEDQINIIGATCGMVFFYYGLFSYFEAGISQGNYGLIGIPLGFGMITGFLTKFISTGG